MIDLKHFNELKHICFVQEAVKEYAVKLKNIDRILRVKIFQDERGKYYARSNYKIGTKPNATPYVSMDDGHDTIENALHEALVTSMMSFNSDITNTEEHMIEDNDIYYS